MTDAGNNGKFFWLLNLLAAVAVLSVAIQAVSVERDDSPYRLRLNEITHYVAEGFDLSGDLSLALEVPAGGSVGASLVIPNERVFMQPGDMPYKEVTITARFDFTAQYDALTANTDVIPAIRLPGLGDSYQIYLNGSLITSEWNVSDGDITVHKLARGTVYPINASLFNRGENTLTFRVYGDPSTYDTGLIVTEKYVIDDLSQMKQFNFSQTIFAGICLAVSITFMVFFVLYREKNLNLWFSITAASISLYAFIRAGALLGILVDYKWALRIELFALFTFAYFTTGLIFISGKGKLDTVMKVFTGIYVVLSAALLLPGHQFVLDLLKVLFVLFTPFILYSFIGALLIPFIKDMKSHKSMSLRRAASGTLRGNMLVGSFLPVFVALVEQIAFVIFSYQEIVLSQYGFLFFFANVTFALASDNAQMHGKLLILSNELRGLIAERETELAQKSGEIAEVKSEQARFRDTVSKEIRAPIGEIIGAIELQMLRTGAATDAAGWLFQLLEAQRGVRQKIDHFLNAETDYADSAQSAFEFSATRPRAVSSAAGAKPGDTRHLFVINPKSFVTLKDLKNFLLSIETCFSAGHRAEYKIYISRYPRDAYSAVHRYLSATPPDETARVYSVGGDGILFDCLNGLAPFPNAELAPIPYGNANDFVRSFGAENMDLFRDVRLMSKSPSRLVDLILCGQQYALCSCSIGIEAQAVQVFANVIEKINTGKARVFVPLLYKLGAIKSLIDDSRNNTRYRISIDGTDFSGDYLFASIGNIALNGGSNTPNPLAVPDDGILDVILCKSSSLMNSLHMLTPYTSGRYVVFPNYMRHIRLKEMHCESDDLMSVILDGETFYTHDLDLKVLPKAVKIVSPNGIGFADFSASVKGESI